MVMLEAKNIFHIDWNALLEKIRTYSPRKTGALSEHWNIVEQSETRAVFENDLPYARIQDIGGTIPAVDGKLMVFEIGGETIYTTKRKAIFLKGSNYTQHAFDDWFTGQGRN
jgi:hypothetical protein